MQVFQMETMPHVTVSNPYTHHFAALHAPVYVTIEMRVL